MNTTQQVSGQTVTYDNSGKAIAYTGNSGANTPGIVAPNLDPSYQPTSTIAHADVTTPTPTIPTTPGAGTSANGLVDGNNTGLVSDTYSLVNGQFVKNPAKDNSTDNFTKAFNDYIGNMPAAPNAEAIYNSSPEKAAYDQAAADVNNYTGIINGITSKAQANKLAIIGQGRGIPEAIIGGQSAQIDRETAIQALPYQALLANAQGNKELAQTHLDTMVKLRIEDATNAYNYKVKLLDSVYNFATESEKRKLDKVDKASATNLSLLSAAVNDIGGYASSLMSTSPKIAAKLIALTPPDVNSATFMADMAKFKAQASALVSGAPIKATGTESKVPTTYTVTKNDTGGLYAIASKLGLKPENLIAVNQDVNPINMKAGQIINLPSAANASATTKLFDNTNIPADIRGNILTDIKGVKNLKVADLQFYYPEVDTTYLSKLLSENQ